MDTEGRAVYCCRPRQDSGIGLSLSRQIMQLHKGSITVQSRPGTETVFTLKF